MCKTNDGTPCPRSETPSPTANPKRRTCATPGCNRIESGGAKHCRTCRAEAPLRADLAELTEANERIGADWSRATACIDATHEILDGANVSRAHHLGGGLSLEGRVESLVRNRDTVVSLYTEVVIKRDEAVKALGLAHAAAKGQKERLRRAKAERDSATATVRQLTEQVGALTIQLDEASDMLIKAGEALNARAMFAERLWGELAHYVEGENVAWDAAQSFMLDRDEARAEATTLRLRLRIMYAVAALLGIAAVAGGVL